MYCLGQILKGEKEDEDVDFLKKKPPVSQLATSKAGGGRNKHNLFKYSKKHRRIGGKVAAKTHGFGGKIRPLGRSSINCRRVRLDNEQGSQPRDIQAHFDNLRQRRKKSKTKGFLFCDTKANRKQARIASESLPPSSQLSRTNQIHSEILSGFPTVCFRLIVRRPAC